MCTIFITNLLNFLLACLTSHCHLYFSFYHGFTLLFVIASCLAFCILPTIFICFHSNRIIDGIVRLINITNTILRKSPINESLLDDIQGEGDELQLLFNGLSELARTELVNGSSRTGKSNAMLKQPEYLYNIYYESDGMLTYGNNESIGDSSMLHASGIGNKDSMIISHTEVNLLPKRETLHGGSNILRIQYGKDPIMIDWDAEIEKIKDGKIVNRFAFNYQI